MAYVIAPAMPGDLDRVLEIYAYARKFMAENGNPHQWGTVTPQKALLEEDIERKQLYAVRENGVIHGVFAFILGEDPTYKKIYEGVWHKNQAYGTIHRIASDGSGGIFNACISFCGKKIDYLRIDTHKDNHIMQHVVEKAGFRRCGIIYIADGTPRIAYDR